VWLSNHLDHELHINKDYYRNHNAIFEVSKISRMMMVHYGKTSKYAGKSLADIRVEGNNVLLMYFWRPWPHQHVTV
jgi:hypothetical protein